MRTPPAAEAVPGTTQLAALHGARLTDIGRSLYRSWQHAPATDATHAHSPARVLTPQQHAMAKALVHLRRTQESRFDHHLHQAHATAEAARLDAHQVSVAAYLAIPSHAPVHILGESEPGIVIHTVIGQEPTDTWPTAWYVVAAPAAGICRAHGTDEIEETPMGARDVRRFTRR